MINKIKSYFQGVVTETKKVVWPTRRQVIEQTTTVIVTVLVGIAIFGLVDYGLAALVRFLVIKG